MNNIKLTIAYDGKEFYGWQKTKIGPTVEGELQKALEQILQEPVQLQAASRTDRGVHALGQVVNFFTSKPLNFVSLNRLLPPSIAVLSLEEMPPDFHPTLHVLQKEYRYEICCGVYQLPQHRCSSWHVPGELDAAKMQQAAALLMGTHDFSSFCINRKKGEYDDCRRTMLQITVEPMGDKRLQITVVGKSFFYKLVRCIAGTLAAVGKGKINLSDVENLLRQKSRSFSGVTAPAHGLTLVKVEYQ